MATYIDGMEKHNSDNIEATTRIKTFEVSITFTDMVANNPLEAAKKACRWLLENNDAENMTYQVIDENSGEGFTVDLSEPDEDAVLPY